MRIAYLDTSYLSELARVRRTSPGRFSQFREFWHQNDLALAFSTTHMREAIRYGGRQERFELLQLLLPVVSDLPIVPVDGPRPSNVAEKEVLRALVGQGLVGAPPESHAKVLEWCDVWPTTASTPAEGGLFALYDQQEIQRMEGLVYAAHKQGASAAARPDDQAYNRQRLSEFPNRIWTEEEVEHARAMMLAALEDVPIWTEFPWHEAGSSPEQGKADATAFIERMLEQAQTIGLKAAYLQTLGIKDPEPLGKKFTDDLVQDWWFDQAVRAVVTKLANGDADLCEQVIALNLLPVCPGSWLRGKVAVEIRRAVKQPDPNHEYDLDHLSYFPHVDVFMCDAEMAQLTVQVLRRPNVPPSVSALTAPISVPLNIESIQNALRSSV